jgi:hypothetical protein
LVIGSIAFHPLGLAACHRGWIPVLENDDDDDDDNSDDDDVSDDNDGDNVAGDDVGAKAVLNDVDCAAAPKKNTSLVAVSEKVGAVGGAKENAERNCGSG